MTAFLYILNTICSAGQSTLGKQYAYHGGNATTFNINKAISGVFMFLLFGLFNGISFHIPSLCLGMCYGVFLCISMYTGFQALATGPMSLTGIIASFSLVIPFVFGITVWREALTVYGITGFFLLLCSIVLLNLKKERNVSVKWSIYAFITMIANGICSLIQKYHQSYYPNLYRNEFMLSALLCVLLVLIAAEIIKSHEKTAIKLSVSGMISGIMNGAANYIVLYLAATEKASVMFPIVSVANVIAVWTVGRILFKERLKYVQILGLVLGLSAILLLNLQR